MIALNSVIKINFGSTKRNDAKVFYVIPEYCDERWEILTRIAIVYDWSHETIHTIEHLFKLKGLDVVGAKDPDYIVYVDDNKLSIEKTKK